MANIAVRPITASDTLPLRRAILRPGAPPVEAVFAGDDARETVHLGAVVDGELLGIASLYHEPPPHDSDARAWRLRGMAVAEHQRRRGFGGALVRACEQHVLRHGGQTLWFNARITAVPFYQSLGYRIRGEQFEVPKVGPHYFMWKQL